MTYGRIEFRYGHLIPRTIEIKHCPDVASLNAFAVFLQNYTRAEVTKIEFVETYDITGAQSSGDFGDTRLNAVLKMRGLDEDEDYKLTALIIPAPKDSIFEESGNYRKVLESVGQDLIAAYEAMSGKSFRYERGWLTGNTR